MPDEYFQPEHRQRGHNTKQHTLTVTVSSSCHAEQLYYAINMYIQGGQKK